jgi:hypothetical protein
VKNKDIKINEKNTTSRKFMSENIGAIDYNLKAILEYRDYNTEKLIKGFAREAESMHCKGKIPIYISKHIGCRSKMFINKGEFAVFLGI